MGHSGSAAIGLRNARRFVYCHYDAHRPIRSRYQSWSVAGYYVLIRRVRYELDRDREVSSHRPESLHQRLLSLLECQDVVVCAAVERNAVAVDKRMVIRGGTQVVSELDVVGDRGAVEVLRWMDPLGVVG